MALQIPKYSRDPHVIEVKMADKAVSLIVEGLFTGKLGFGHREEIGLSKKVDILVWSLFC